MCKVGGPRCAGADELHRRRQRVKRSVSYQEGGSYRREELLQQAEAKFIEECPELAREHLPKAQPWTTKAKPLPRRQAEALTHLFPRPRSASQEEADAHCRALYEEHERLVARSSQEEVEALRWYSFVGFEVLNPYLRRGRLASSLRGDEEGEKLRQKVEEGVAHLDSALAKAEEGRPRMLYRYQAFLTPLSSREFAEAYYPVGARIRDKGFLSTSEEPGLMAGMLHKHRGRKLTPMVFQLISPRGASLQRQEREDSSTLQSLEKERLLPRNVPFRVVAHRRVTFEVSEERGALSSSFQTATGGYGSLPKQNSLVVYLMDEALLQDDNQASLLVENLFSQS